MPTTIRLRVSKAPIIPGADSNVREQTGVAAWKQPIGMNLRNIISLNEQLLPMEKLVRDRKVQTLVIIAPPRTLSDLRHAFHPDVKSRILAEINKDLIKHTVSEIEKHLVG